jgi:hypothetical protein
MVAGEEHDLLGRRLAEPGLERSGEEPVFGVQVALERERHVVANEQQVAGRDVDEVLVQVGDADDRGHGRELAARIVASPADMRPYAAARRNPAFWDTQAAAHAGPWTA